MIANDMITRKMENLGIDIIENIPWGTHFCQFYQTKEDLIDILVPYFQEGLENNEFCMWITSEPLLEIDAKKALQKAIPDIDNYLKRGQIEILPYTEWYVKGNVFDSQKVLNGWIDKLNNALEKGFGGLRLSGNTFWLEKDDWNSFVEYEADVDNIIGKYNMKALCTYSIDKCNAAEIIEVINNHEFALVKREGKWESIESSEHKRAKEEATQAKMDWTQTFDAIPDLMAILDEEHKVIRANKAMADKLNITPDECIGLPCYVAIHGSDSPPSFCPHSKLLKDGCEHTTEVHEDSLGGDFLVSASPLCNCEGELTGSIHVARDITKRKLMEEELRQARDNLEERVRKRTLELKKIVEELEHSNEELQSFAYITSHDLQEPLRTIASYAQLLKRRYHGQLDQDADEFIDYMVSGSKRMKDQIQGLLDYSRVGTQGQEFEEFMSEETLNNALLDLHWAVNDCNAEITHDSLPEILADKDQITRVFQNLIGNALKFRKEGVRPKIHISAQREENEYVFSVSDNGIGLEEEYSDRIFEVFKRLHAIGEYEGAGIGLAIVKRIIDRHKGRIWVKSTFGKGSTFYFTIPMKKDFRMN